MVETSAAPRPPSRARTIELEPGLEIQCQTANEARFLYEDIFVEHAYARHGIQYAGARTILDVGANIGLFTLYACRQAPEARIWAFEPAPPLFALLEANTAAHAERVRLVPRAVSRQAGRAELTFYPQSSGMSSLYADLDEEREALRAVFERQRQRGQEGMDEVMRHADELLDVRFEAEVLPVELTTLSTFLAAEGLEQVDLLKIDVQKAEEDVLAGLDDADWPRIRQIVLEVHDLDGRLNRLERELVARGFEVVSEQDDFYTTSIIHNVYARRPEVQLHAWGSVAERLERLRTARAAVDGPGGAP